MKLTILKLLGLWLLLVAVGSMHTYGDTTTSNAGVYWNSPAGHHWCGYEFKGHPGFFCDTD